MAVRLEYTRFEIRYALKTIDSEEGLEAFCYAVGVETPPKCVHKHIIHVCQTEKLESALAVSSIKIPQLNEISKGA